MGGYSRLHSVLEGLRTVRAHLETGESRRKSKPQPAVRRHKLAQRLTSETLAEMVGAYRAGSSTPVLAEQYGVSTTAVKRLLHVRGVPVCQCRRLSESAVLEAAELYGAGWSLVKLGRRFNVDDETVRQRLRQVGVVMRGAHEWRKH